MAILPVPWKVRMSAVSEGGTGGAVGTIVQTALQELIHISSENRKGSKLHPRALPYPISAPLLYSTSHFPWWEQPGSGPSPSSSSLGWWRSILHALLTSLELNYLVYPLITSNLRAVLPRLQDWVLQVLYCLAVLSCYLLKHDGDPTKEPSLHLCLSVSAVWKKINIAVCC